jgi:hypothetical protein
MLNESELLTQYGSGPAQLKAAIAGLPETSLDLALDDHSWSIRQIVHHIVDGDDVWIHCIKMALGDADATFDLRWYLAKPQIQWAEIWAYRDRDIEPSLTLFSANRNHIIQLMTAIEVPWERTILIQLIDKQEQVTLEWVVEMQCNHLTGHIENIHNIRKMWGF